MFIVLVKVELSFRYLAFNTNTIETLESTGDIKLMPEKIRNLLIELKREQEQNQRVAEGNYEIYLNAQQKAFQLGYGRLFLKTPEVIEIDVIKNIPEIILTLEAGFILKNFTDKLIRDSLLKMLTNIYNIKELVYQDIK